MRGTQTKVAQGGRIVIPAKFRRALGIKVGDEVVVEMVDREVRVLSRKEALARAQKLVRNHVPAKRSLADELIAERRAEAMRE